MTFSQEIIGLQYRVVIDLEGLSGGERRKNYFWVEMDLSGSGI